MKDVPEYRDKPVLIFGCGNILFGDDGFGPAVANELMKSYNIPDFVGVIDAGTSVREFLFNIALDEIKPIKIIIIDAVDVGKKPGEIFEIDLDELPEKKIDDFSMHQLPTSNLLRELRDLADVEITILSCQVDGLPESVKLGLSDTLTGKVKEMCDIIVKNHFKS